MTESPPVKDCRSCGREIVFVPTAKGRMTPINADDGDPHWVSCPGAEEHRQRDTKPDNGQGRLW